MHRSPRSPREYKPLPSQDFNFTYLVVYHHYISSSLYHPTDNAEQREFSAKEMALHEHETFHALKATLRNLRQYAAITIEAPFLKTAYIALLVHYMRLNSSQGEFNSVPIIFAFCLLALESRNIITGWDFMQLKALQMDEKQETSHALDLIRPLGALSEFFSFIVFMISGYYFSEKDNDAARYLFIYASGGVLISAWCNALEAHDQMQRIDQDIEMKGAATKLGGAAAFIIAISLALLVDDTARYTLIALGIKMLHWASAFYLNIAYIETCKAKVGNQVGEIAAENNEVDAPKFHIKCPTSPHIVISDQIRTEEVEAYAPDYRMFCNKNKPCDKNMRITYPLLHELFVSKMAIQTLFILSGVAIQQELVGDSFNTTIVALTILMMLFGKYARASYENSRELEKFTEDNHILFYRPRQTS